MAPLNALIHSFVKYLGAGGRIRIDICPRRQRGASPLSYARKIAMVMTVIADLFTIPAFIVQTIPIR